MGCLLFHKWAFCKCSKCEAVRDQDHKWNGCKCQVCGKEKEHDWVGCKCRTCEAVRDQDHNWATWKVCFCSVCHKEFHEYIDCKCRKCGTVRDQNHKWSGCTCEVCGKENHEYIDYKCRICAKDISSCFGKFYEYREIKDCSKCSARQLCEDQYKSKFVELEKKEAKEKAERFRLEKEAVENRAAWLREQVSIQEHNIVNTFLNSPDFRLIKNSWWNGQYDIFPLMLLKKMIDLPIVPNAYAHSFGVGGLMTGCRRFETLDSAYRHVIISLAEIAQSEIDHNVRDWTIEYLSAGILVQGSSLRAIFFLTKRGMDYFDGIRIARIANNSYVIRRQV